MKNSILLFSTLLLSAPVFAADDISLGEPGYGGTGCPAGTVSVTLSPDAKSLSLLFDQYQVAVGGIPARALTARAAISPFLCMCPKG
jgi:hypothetical protein